MRCQGSVNQYDLEPKPVLPEIIFDTASLGNLTAELS
eukprot:COSAG02_NODE_71146_length_192_cov_35.086022_1_plen_36_part_01